MSERARAAGVLITLCASTGCGGPRATAPEATVACDNASIAITPSVTVIAPHPDDETLGFLGVIDAAKRAGARVHVVITTDGQTNCVACALWKYGHPRGPGEEACSADELGAFGRTRRDESTRALALVGVTPAEITFLGYVDTTLQALWREPNVPVLAPLCGGATPAGDKGLLGASLREDLASVLRRDAPASVFTTHPLDGHADHGTLYSFVRDAIDRVAPAVPIYTSVIHNHAYSPCDYPNPPAPGVLCAKTASSPTGFAEVRKALARPLEPWRPPTDTEYGKPLSFCLRDALFRGDAPLKARAIDTYATQIGVSTRRGGRVEPAYEAWVDRYAYLARFTHRNEIFYRDPPATAGDVRPPPDAH